MGDRKGKGSRQYFEINEFLSVKSLFNYRQLLEVVGENGTTDMSLDEMLGMMNEYHSALSNISRTIS